MLSLKNGTFITLRYRTQFINKLLLSIVVESVIIINGLGLASTAVNMDLGIAYVVIVAILLNLILPRTKLE